MLSQQNVMPNLSPALPISLNTEWVVPVITAISIPTPARVKPGNLVESGSVILPGFTISSYTPLFNPNASYQIAPSGECYVDRDQSNANIATGYFFSLRWGKAPSTVGIDYLDGHCANSIQSAADDSAPGDFPDVVITDTWRGNATDGTSWEGVITITRTTHSLVLSDILLHKV